MKISKKIAAIVLMAIITVSQCGVMNVFASSAESLDYSTMVSDSVKSKGSAIDKTSVNYQFLYGDYNSGSDKLKAFSATFGTGAGAPDDILVNPAGISDVGTGLNVLWRWQWRASKDSATVLKLKAKENVKIDITQKETIKDQWAIKSAYKFFAEDDNKNKVLLNTVMVTATMEPDYVKTTVNLAKGDTLYIVYAMTDDATGTVTATYIPQFAVDPSGYDNSKRAKFEAVASLTTAKKQKKDDLNAKLTQMKGDGTAYSVSRTAEMEEIVTKAIDAMKDLTTEAEVQSAYNEAVAKMDAVPTAASEAAELANYVAQQKEALASYADKSKYTSENWTIIQGYIDQANTKIDQAKVVAAINTAVASAKASIDKVEKKTVNTYNSGSVNVNSGYILWIIIGAVVVVAATVAVVLVLFRRKKNKTAQ